MVDDGRSGSGRVLPTNRLAEVTTAHAMTVHRSQGSQFDEVTVLLPESGSLILTRELFYTAVTRARKRVRVVGSDAAVHRVAAGLQFTLPGVPMLFAGDEIGLEGVNGEDARRPMPWDRPEQWDRTTLAAACAAGRLSQRPLHGNACSKGT